MQDITILCRRQFLSRLVEMFLSYMLLDIIDMHDIFDTQSCVASFSFIWVLFSDTINEKLKEFLIARNPKHQHSATLDSYLIKPIQRILKYPLLLQQLCNLTDSDTDEHHHLSGNYQAHSENTQIPATSTTVV